MRLRFRRMYAIATQKVLMAGCLGLLLHGPCDVPSCEAGLRTRWQQRRSNIRHGHMAHHARPIPQSTLANTESHETQATYWTRRIACNPCDSDAYAKRAAARFQLDLLDDAIFDLSTAIRIRPKHAVYYTERAHLLLVAKRSDDALRDLNQALQIDPNNEEARALRAVVGLAANVSDDQSMNDLTIAAQQSSEPFSPWLIQFRGTQHLNQGRYAEAIEDFTECLKHSDDEDPTAKAGTYLLRASAFEKSKQYENAIEDYSKFIELIPNEPWGYIARAAVYVSMGDRIRALDEYATVIARWPEKPYGYAQKAWTLATCKIDAIRDGRAAVELATRAWELEPSNRFAMQVLAAAYAEQSDFERAIEWQEKAISAYDPKPAASANDSKPSSRSWTITLIGPPPDDEKKREAVARLESYRVNKPLRQ